MCKFAHRFMQITVHRSASISSLYCLLRVQQYVCYYTAMLSVSSVKVKYYDGSPKTAAAHRQQNILPKILLSGLFLEISKGLGTVEERGLPTRINAIHQCLGPTPDSVERLYLQ